jgi:hypothetical protein
MIKINDNNAYCTLIGPIKDYKDVTVLKGQAVQE